MFYCASARLPKQYFLWSLKVWKSFISLKPVIQNVIGVTVVCFNGHINIDWFSAGAVSE